MRFLKLRQPLESAGDRVCALNNGRNQRRIGDLLDRSDPATVTGIGIGEGVTRGLLAAQFRL